MTKPQMLIVNLPFPGFYESLYSYAIDREEEQFGEYRCDEYEKDNADNEGYWPESLRLDTSNYADILCDVTDYSAAYARIARDYVSAFDHIAGEAFGFTVKAKRKRHNYDSGKLAVSTETYDCPSIRAAFESMDSPREYNFATDRLYAHIPLNMMTVLFRKSKADQHATLEAVIRSRFTSRSGFISGYSNEMREWLAKPLKDWDHNELGTLLIAAMRDAGADPDEDETRDALYDATCGNEGAYQAWESAVDWPAFEAKRLEARAEKLAEWIEEDSEAVATWRAQHATDYAAIVAAEPSLFAGFEEVETVALRCSQTIDLFTGQPG